MKARNLTATALVLAALVTAPAFASISTGNLGVDVQSALGSGGNVSVTLEDGIATLSGNVDGAGTRNKVYQAALNNADVDQVINLVQY